MQDNKINSNNEQYNPYSSPVYTDGDLFKLKRDSIKALEVLIDEADQTYSIELTRHLEAIQKLTYKIDLIFSAIEENGYSVQSYPASPSMFDTFV